jgi:hypothetical protein
MTDAFVNISIETRGEGRAARYHVVLEAGDGRRTVSPGFRTLFAAQQRAQAALLDLQRRHPEAEVIPGDEPRTANVDAAANNGANGSAVRHEGAAE